MYHRYFYGALARISNLEETDFDIEPLVRRRWATGDYVVGRVDRPPSAQSQLEICNGRLLNVSEGDFIVGALGARFATRGVTGDWEAIGENGSMEALTAAGLIGKARSKAAAYAPLISLAYRGHVSVNGRRVNMKDFVPATSGARLSMPTVLLVGSSMSAGKTTSAKVIIRLLKEAGLTVVGVKFTGAGRYQDILGMRDAGADFVFDFADVGLPSTFCPESEFRPALRELFSMIADTNADVLVAEAGASPLEPYNSAVAVEEIEPNVKLMVLCASDPYSALGVRDALARTPDLVAGLATSTEAGVQLVEKLSGYKAINILDRDAHPELLRRLRQRLEF